MSQQAAAGQGAPAGRGGGQGTRNMGFHPRSGDATKGFKLSISEIAMNTFNTGQNKFAAQFTLSQKNVANSLQCTSAYEGYLVAETVRAGREQTIALPPAVDASAPDAADLKIIRDKEVNTIAKRRLKLSDALKKGYATVYDRQTNRSIQDLKASWTTSSAEEESRTVEVSSQRALLYLII
jgi:hypothetical protein